MDTIRAPFSKLKKKFKHRLTGRKSKSNKTAADTGGSNSTSLRPSSDSRVVAGDGQDREGGETNADGSQVLSTNRPPQPDEPESVPARGSENDQERREADIDGSEVNQTHSLLDPDVEVAVGSEPGREGKTMDEEKVEQVYPSPSPTSIPHGGKPDGT